MTADFVAAVIEGFEGTLDVVLEHILEIGLRRKVEALQEHIGTKREQFLEIHRAHAGALVRIFCISRRSREIDADAHKQLSRPGFAWPFSP